MKWNLQSSAALNAGTQLPKLAKKYFAAGREAARGHKSPRDLHRFRVRTKRFRYALEMFRPVYGPELESRLAALQQVQKVLGKISDLYTIRELLEQDGEFKKALLAEGKKKTAEFRAYWSNTFDAPHEKKAWTSTL